MDARSVDIAALRRTRLLTEPDAELDSLRSDMIDAENRIVEDVDRLQEMLNPEKIANRLVSSAMDEVFTLVRTAEAGKFKELGNKVKAGIKKHPFVSTFIGLGLVCGAVAYWSLLKNGDTGRMEQDGPDSKRQGPG